MPLYFWSKKWQMKHFWKNQPTQFFPVVPSVMFASLRKLPIEEGSFCASFHFEIAPLKTAENKAIFITGRCWLRQQNEDYFPPKEYKENREVNVKIEIEMYKVRDNAIKNANLVMQITMLSRRKTSIQSIFKMKREKKINE